MRLGIRATWNGTADFSAAIRRAVFSGLSSIGVSLAEPSSVIRQVIKVQNMALLCTRCGLIGADVRPDAFRQTGAYNGPGPVGHAAHQIQVGDSQKRSMSIFQTSFLRSGAPLASIASRTPGALC